MQQQFDSDAVLNSAVAAIDGVETTEHIWIPMRDGIRLSARIWLPENARQNPVPAVLEYIPYRKRDMKRARDTRMFPYFAVYGYAGVRVDIRGSGDSEGILKDEYLLQEQEDGEDVLKWIENQSWCDGNIGMIGISWGGFNGLQMAARQPPQLKAVISLSSTDDRYSDDVHYMGGCLLNDNLSWASTMFAFNSLPPDPEIVGDRWRDMWIRRMEESGLWVETWMRHQYRDEYWKHGSIAEDYDAIKIPVMVVGGWADGYSNAVFRMLEHLKVPCRGLIGPWSHVYPHEAATGPKIGFLQECLRWWDAWLRGRETDVADEPKLMVWMQESVEPRTAYRERPGRWVTESSWPSPHIEFTTFPLARGRILQPDQYPADNVDEPISVQSPLSVGLFAGKWHSHSSPAPDLPYDQREEDGGSVVFDSDPLEQSLELLGPPVVELELEANKPAAMIAVRLSDVAPDHMATRMTYGLLNLCHRRSSELPEPMTEGRTERIRMTLNDIGQRIPAGHRIRMSISTSYWPLAWPPPEAAKLRIFSQRSSLVLPVRPLRTTRDKALIFDRPEAAPPLQTTVLAPNEHNWIITRDLAKDESTLEVIHDDGCYRIDEIDLEIERCTREWYRFRGFDFESVSGEVRAEWGLRRGTWDVQTNTLTLLTCTRDHFVLHATLDAFESNRRVMSKTWNSRIPRLFV